MMKTPIYSIWYSLALLFIVFNLVSCKKNTAEPDDNQENYTIGFKFQEFENVISPLGTITNTKISRAEVGRPLVRAAAQSRYEGLIYYWSFNNETLLPERYPSTHWSLTYNQGQIPDTYAAGWPYEDYDAGRALSLKGVEELIFKMPLTGVLSVDELAFDVGSSGTGPKSFSLSYSQDGHNYTVLEADNQFSNTNTAQARNTFVFPLGELSLDFSKDLYIKLIPQAGLRGNAGDYNAVTGIMRVDNFRLLGVAEQIADASVRRIHYHIFDAGTKNLVLAGADHFREGALSDFALMLPAGEYIASFVTNVSNAELIIPEAGDAASYFMANTFSNSKAKIFGVLDTFVVAGNIQRDMELNRYYSAIKFEFTDSEDLSEVSKLLVRSQHGVLSYAPFNLDMESSVSDDSELIIYPEFNHKQREISFNQFIGQASIPVTVAYEVEVYDSSDELIRTFQVESEIRNNMQLLFRGQLLDTPNGGFMVRLNESWDGEKAVEF